MLTRTLLPPIYTIAGSNGDEAEATSLTAAQTAARTLVVDDGNARAVATRSDRWIGTGELDDAGRYIYRTTQGS